MSEPVLSPKIPPTVWALGLVSLCMDLSSEMVHSLLPVFLVSSLGASMLSVGLIEGVAEATALIVKVFSGAISDFIGRRKGLILLGYGMAALTKPFFPLANSVETVFTARFLDRVGKGIRGAPRDALIADVAPPAIRGACYGLRQSLDTIGAFLGPAIAILLMLALDDIKQVLWFAVVPAFVAVLFIVIGVQEPEQAKTAAQQFESPIRLNSIKHFPAAYWWVVVIGMVFMLARFSEAFLVLRAQEVGLSATWIPLVMVVMSLFYTLSAYPVGILSDRISRSTFLALGLVLLIFADITLAVTQSIGGILFGVALWGLHMGFSQGTLSTLIADTTPLHLKGTAFGIFSLASGIFMLLASLLAGWLWQSYGSAATFTCGGLFSIAALLLLGVQKWRMSLVIKN